MLVLLLACWPGPTPIDTADPGYNPDRFSSFYIRFAGDTDAWTDVVSQCYDSAGERMGANAAFSTVEGVGEARLSFDDYVDCSEPYFNVRGYGVNNTDPNVLGIPGEALTLLVTDAWNTPIYPWVAEGGEFWEGDAPSFDSERGWLYLPDDY